MGPPLQDNHVRNSGRQKSKNHDCEQRNGPSPRIDNQNEDTIGHKYERTDFHQPKIQGAKCACHLVLRIEPNDKCRNDETNEEAPQRRHPDDHHQPNADADFDLLLQPRTG
jgi:hypothetical protein